MNETIITIPSGLVPSYFLYIVTSILIMAFISLTYAYKSKNGIKFKDFWMVILFSVLIIAIIIGFLVVMPDLFANWVTKLTSFFGF